ncbi:diguanylate cyclase [Billgrantia sulfidoxydans]|uniref:Diguanylate cyclase n=1 Tax=Billgrantia sulfidoxydans TaxID=2733484 RepID=A0ABX7W4W1_9GAMM|nr:diguanylate cyclase [Halomonas sulfidoxydans]QTP55369.1 diguanylate cyclase [Halomonas sulfidoxydans]
MTLQVLCRRLIAAVVVPVILVTATLYPILQAHLGARLDGAASAADAKLEAGLRVLQSEINASINHLLATAEMPLLQRYLTGVGTVQSPRQEATAHLTEARLHALFETLLPHYARYTQLSLIDSAGRELVHVGDAPAQPERHAEAIFFLEAMALAPRDVYVAAPSHAQNRQTAGAFQLTIATPVFDTLGKRKGVLRFTLDWHHLATDIQRTVAMEVESLPFMIDARGTWLLTEMEGPLAFGDSFAAHSPLIWEALLQRNRGEVDDGDQRVLFRAYDARIDHYHSQAGMVTGPPGYYPWRLGITVTQPALATLLAEQPTAVLIALLLYVLSITFGVYWAISHHRQQTLRQQAQRLSQQAHDYAHEVRDLYENAPCGYHSLDADGRVVKINRTELNWLGYAAEEVIGKRDYRDFVTPETREAFEAAFRQVLGPQREGSAECELVTRSGDTLPVVIQATAYHTRQGFVHSRAMVFDLSERKRLEEALARQAMTDPLTGLGNRRYLKDQASLEMARARRSGAPLSLIVIDLDHFKRINDEYGHDIGDLVLQDFARNAAEQLREGDVLCRMGGEEFAVLLPDTPKEAALLIAERLRQALESSPAAVDEEVEPSGQLRYTASMGVTWVNPEASTLKPAIKRADTGLYEAKARGRNRVVWQGE